MQTPHAHFGAAESYFMRRWTQRVHIWPAAGRCKDKSASEWHVNNHKLNGRSPIVDEIASMTTHIGIVGCSAEGAALCYRTICQEGSELLGQHRHPEVSMHTPSLSEYV